MSYNLVKKELLDTLAEKTLVPSEIRQKQYEDRLKKSLLYTLANYFNQLEFGIKNYYIQLVTELLSMQQKMLHLQESSSSLIYTLSSLEMGSSETLEIGEILKYLESQKVTPPQLEETRAYLHRRSDLINAMRHDLEVSGGTKFHGYRAEFHKLDAEKPTLLSGKHDSSQQLPSAEENLFDFCGKINNVYRQILGGTTDGQLIRPLKKLRRLIATRQQNYNGVTDDNLFHIENSLQNLIETLISKVTSDEPQAPEAFEFFRYPAAATNMTLDVGEVRAKIAAYLKRPPTIKPATADQEYSEFSRYHP